MTRVALRGPRDAGLGPVVFGSKMGYALSRPPLWDERGISMKIALLLLAMGFGYKVFAEASKNTKKSLKTLGRVVGTFMMIVALMGTVCAGFHMMNRGLSGEGYSSYHKSQCNKWAERSEADGKKFCPFSGKSIHVEAE